MICIKYMYLSSDTYTVIYNFKFCTILNLNPKSNSLHVSPLAHQVMFQALLEWESISWGETCDWQPEYADWPRMTATLKATTISKQFKITNINKRKPLWGWSFRLLAVTRHCYLLLSSSKCYQVANLFTTNFILLNINLHFCEWFV